MATNFPTSVDVLTNPVSNDSLNSPSHSAQHANANDAIEAIETTLFAGGINYTGLVHINTTTLSAASTVTFTNVFSSTYDNYRLVWNGAGAASHSMRITFGSAAAGYYSQLMDFRSSAAAPTTQAVISNGAYGLFGNNWNGGSSIDCLISNPFTAAYTTFASTFTASESAISATGSAGGSLNNTTSYTSCTIVPSSATTFTGTFRLYGLRNS